MVKETWKGLQRSSSVARVHVRDLIVSNRQEYFSLFSLIFCLSYLFLKKVLLKVAIILAAKTDCIGNTCFEQM